MQKYLVLGATGGLGSSVVRQLRIDGYIVIPVSRFEVDFCTESCGEEIFDLLDIHRPDVIINCIGVFRDNNCDFDEVINVNLKSNWLISKYYISKRSTVGNVKIVFVGSSSYKQGKKDYILYSASKAALHNLYEGVSAYFVGTNVLCGIVHPGRMDTKMIRNLERNSNLDYLDPHKVAVDVIEFASRMTENSILTIN